MRIAKIIANKLASKHQGDKEAFAKKVEQGLYACKTVAEANQFLKSVQ
jgi:6-phosphogluconate dehydrogenase